MKKEKLCGHLNKWKTEFNKIQYFINNECFKYTKNTRSHEGSLPKIYSKPYREW